MDHLAIAVLSQYRKVEHTSFDVFIDITWSADNDLLQQMVHMKDPSVGTCPCHKSVMRDSGINKTDFQRRCTFSMLLSTYIHCEVDE